MDIFGKRARGDGAICVQYKHGVLWVTGMNISASRRVSHSLSEHNKFGCDWFLCGWTG